MKLSFGEGMILILLIYSAMICAMVLFCYIIDSKILKKKNTTTKHFEVEK